MYWVGHDLNFNQGIMLFLQYDVEQVQGLDQNGLSSHLDSIPHHGV